MDKKNYCISRIEYVLPDGSKNFERTSVVVHDIESYRRKLLKDGYAEVNFVYDETGK